MDSEGGWYFRRFWEPRHSYFWLPLLTSDLQIAAKFFGRTSSWENALFHSISVPNGRWGRFLTATWHDDIFLDHEMAARLPASHQQILDANYLSLLDRASQRESLEKIVDYLGQMTISGLYAMRSLQRMLERFTRGRSTSRWIIPAPSHLLEESNPWS